MTALAALGDHAGVNLWTYRTDDGRSIQQALDWLVPFASGEQKWPYKQTTALDAGLIAPLLRQAAIVYHDDRYQQLGDRIAGGDPASDRINLLLAIPPEQ